MERDGFVFYRSFAEAINDIGDPTIELNLYKAVVEYGLNGDHAPLTGIESAVMRLIRPQIDANARRYENGKRGGRPKANQEETEEKPKENQTETKSKPNESKPQPKEKDKEKDKVKDKDKENVKEKEDDTRIEFQYGTWMNVILTTDEYVKLGKEMGNRDRDYYIDRLSDYLKNNPKKTYASHYRTLLNWKRGDEHKAELKVIASNGTAAEKRTDSDLYARAMKMGAVTQ